MPIAPVFLHFGWAFGGTEFFLICDYKGIFSSEEAQKKSYYKNTPYYAVKTSLVYITFYVPITLAVKNVSGSF